MSQSIAKATRFTLAALAVSGLLSACTVFPVPEAPRVMDLPVPKAMPVTTKSLPHSLRIDTPMASEPYNGSRILAKPEPWEFRVYGGARWRDSLPVLLQDMLVESFRASSGFQHIVMDPGPGNADLSLVTKITAFHAAHLGASTQVRLSVYGQLVDNRSRAVLCSHNFAVTAPAKDRNIDTVVVAFGQAGAELATSLVAWANSCQKSAD